MTPPAPDALARSLDRLRLAEPWHELRGALRRSRDWIDATEALEAFRARVRVEWRRVARDLHPDRGGNVEAFAETSGAVDWLMRIRVAPRHAVPSKRRVASLRAWAAFLASEEE